jgi:two-component system, cell cycle sensor histidine kinase and response regulator CckA
MTPARPQQDDFRVDFASLVAHVTEYAIYLLTPEGRVASWNEGARRMKGYAGAEALGRHFSIFYLPEEVRGGKCDRELEVASRQGSIEEEGIRLRKNGDQFWASVATTAIRDAGGTLRGFLQVARDLSERKRVEQALRRTKESFRSLIEKLPDQVWVYRRGNVVYANQAVADQLGYSTDELIGRPILDFVHADDAAAMAAHAQTLTRENARAPHRVVHLLRKDGKLATVEVRGLYVVFDNEPAVLAVAHDVSERRQFEARLMMADRLASIGMLAAGVAHEINNPLSYVTANVSFAVEELRASAGPPTEVITALGEAQQGCERVRSIVRDLKAFSRTEESTRAGVDIRRLLDSAANMAWNEIRHRARLSKDYAPRLPLAEANESRLVQVFLNLLVNAAQAIAEGAAERNQIRIVALEAPDGRVAAEISDTGAGIPAENLERIFDPFFTTKPAGIGTGLGLSICQNIVSALGGEIQVESVLGRGSTFRVLLPAAAGNEAQTRRSKVAQGPGEVTGTVLVIDDEPGIGIALKRLLRSEHQVTTVTRAREALDRFRAGERFDAILCDLMMPEMTGMDFHEELSRIDAEAAGRVIFLSGGLFTERARTFLARVPNLRLEKPVEPQSLRALVNERVRAARTRPSS